MTGSSGLVGYQVALRLHEAGADVAGLDLRPAPPDTAFPSSVGDVADLSVVQQAMEGRPNVVHAGAVSGPMLMLDDPHGIAHANLGGAMAVFEACWRLPVRRLVWLSSIAVYGDQPSLDPVTEAAPPNPCSFYGHTKLAGEALLRGYVALYGLPAVALRLSSVFGPRRQTECRLRMVIEAGLCRAPVTVPAEGTSYRQYIHVDDAARAIILALQAPSSGFVYNITGGSYVSEAAIARMIAELIPGLSIIPDPPAWMEGHLGPLSIDAAARDLGYQPRITLADGIAELHRTIAAAA